MSERSAARDVLSELYGVEAQVTRLPGERDLNFRVDLPSGERSILKIMHAGCPEDRVALPCAALRHLGTSERGFDHPHVLPTTRGAPYAEVPWSAEGDETSSRFAWRSSFCPGVVVAEYTPRRAPLLESWGRLLGRLTRGLAGFEHEAAAHPHVWQLTEAHTVRPWADAVRESDRERVIAVLEHFASAVAERLGEIPHSVVHNDANDHNLTVSESAGTGAIDGIFDFGDLCRQPTVCEVAIGAAYAILGQDDPLAAAGAVVRGYVGETPLTEREADLLYDLVATRLAVSVSISSERQRERPDDPYVTISQEPAFEALARWEAVGRARGRAFLRHAAALQPVRSTASVRRLLETDEIELHPVLRLEGGDCVLDLSSGSLLLGADPAGTRLDSLTRSIDAEMKRAAVDFGLGRWGESRALYTTDTFTGGRHPTEESRTHHLGIDVFCPAGTPVLAPLDGTLEIAVDRGQGLDYGGLVVLRHELEAGGEGAYFYTLFGHLSRASVERWSPGDTVRAGEPIATLGDETENGGWTPHLHLQVILDLLDLGSDFPGVALEREASFWRALSPNPERLLGFSNRRDLDGRADLATLKERRARRLGGNLSLSYTEPLHIVRGFGSYLYDSRAQAYLDLYNNVPHVGHSHPRVVEAVQRQIGLLNTNTRYLHETILEYSERLTARLPEPLSVCFLVNSGSEANELALRLARVYTDRRDILVHSGAYHGHTTSLVDVSPYKHGGPGGSGAPEWVHAVDPPDPYRGRWKGDDEGAGAGYAGLVRDALQRAGGRDRPIAAFLSETYPSVGGQIIPPAGYLRAAYEHTRAAGALVIADEIQTGFGRLGEAFWAFESQGAVPDIVVLGKPIANGFPMGAVVTTPEIAAAFDNGMEFFSTFGGNPVACSAALAVLDVVESEGLPARAAELGSRFIADLEELRSDFPLIGDVRGEGFFLGAELVRDPVTLEPAAAETTYLVDRLRDHRILAGTDGIFHNVVKLRPSMVIGREDLELTIERLRSILDETPLRHVRHGG